MKKLVFLKSCLNHRKHAGKVMVLVKMSYQEDPIAVICVVVASPEVSYGIDFYKKCSKRDFSRMSRCLIGALTNHLGLSRRPSEAEFRDLTAGTPPGPQNPHKKIEIHENLGFRPGVTAGVTFS